MLEGINNIKFEMSMYIQCCFCLTEGNCNVRKAEPFLSFNDVICVVRICLDGISE